MIRLLLIDQFHQVYFQQNQEITNNQYHEMSIYLIKKKKINYLKLIILTTIKCLFERSSSKRFVKS